MRRVLAALPGLVLLGVVVWVVLTRWDVLRAGHPAYPITLAVAAVLGAVLAIRGAQAPAERPAGGGRRVLRALGHAVGAVLVLASAAALAWLRPFPADDVALPALDVPDDASVAVVDEIGTIDLVPAEPLTTGLVFSPGARVDPRAYAHVLRPLAEAGYVVVILRPPYGIALANPTQSGAAISRHPEVETWFVGGHSIGGVAASWFAEREAAPDGAVDGLLLWASYPAADLSGTALRACSVTGTNDGLTTPADVADSAPLLPPTTVFTPIDGAIHAYFGDYGPQAGDGEPAVPREEAQRQIVEASLACLDG
ncbi:hypothetical protein Bcav_0227 [Beutenbergia cavernae DSM 12333]|uniref:Alpha/beta hydrolase fold-5 domain-containing protein n=1 Tax=Beutenbergia cavernae (strain ATCC BAA-8 / DSM 12333 / CCUG 43141 / JCM 11478 / NBRC 16432 / NCIMB 13614 / HKI 0122) TaxID=471853 RepID=C5BVQ2_BEUC1|nr:alpha/beta hydrolase [Beutenbergia cavernae]ACQ78492.1 hypothetical protein Bcav_0227 [Beutenbergia cavernae DSM 12333]